MRRSQAAVAQLEGDGESDGVLHPEAAPRRPDARLHGAQRLAVRVTGLEPGVHEARPDGGQLLDTGAEQIDALAAGDLGVEVEVASHLADDDEPLRRDLPAGDARDDRVRAVLLHVRHDVVVGVLQGGVLAVEDVLLIQAREDGRRDGTADVAPAATAVTGDQLAEGGDAADAHDVEQLRAGVGEVLAQVVADLQAGAFQLLAHEPLDERDARTAARPRAGAVLDGGDVGAAVVGDGAADAAGGDVVARTDRGRLRQGPAGGRLDTLGQQPGVGITAERVTDEGAQTAVGRRVAHEDAAQQGGGVVAHDELLVDAGDRVGVHDLEAAGRLPERVPEARDVDAEQLELGGQVGTLERGVSAEEPVGDDLGHRVPGADEPPDPLGDAGHLADRVHVGGAREASLVGQDTAARVHREPRLPGELVARPHAGGEDDDVGVERLAVADQHLGDGSVVAGDESGRGRARAHLDIEPGDDAVQRVAASGVDLERHESVRELDDRGPCPQVAQGAGSLESEQTAAHDDPAGRASGGLGALVHPVPQCCDVLERAVDERARQVGVMDRWTGGVGAGGEHEGVVVDGLRASGDGASLGVDRLDPCTGAQLDAGGLPQRRVAKGEVGRVVELEEARQRHPVVGGAALLAEDDDLPCVGGASLHEGLHEPLGDHACADDDELLAIHGTTVGGVCDVA